MDPISCQLILAQDGDHHAFSEFVRHTQSDVRRFCAWQTKAGSHLDDLVQETFIRAFKGMLSYRAEAPARTWLISIARRVCLDHFAKSERHANEIVSANYLDTADLTESQCNSELPIEYIELVNTLPSAYREAFVWVRLFGYRYEEAAAILDCPVGTVQSRVARARKLLMDAFTASDKKTNNATGDSRGVA